MCKSAAQGGQRCVAHATTALASSRARLVAAKEALDTNPTPEAAKAYATEWDTYGLRVAQYASTASGQGTVREWADQAEGPTQARLVRLAAAGDDLREANRAVRKAHRTGDPEQIHRAAQDRTVGLVLAGVRPDAREWDEPGGKKCAAVGAVLVEGNPNSSGPGPGVYEIRTEDAPGVPQRVTVHKVPHDPTAAPAADRVPVDTVTDGAALPGFGSNVVVTYRKTGLAGRGAGRRVSYRGDALPPVRGRDT